MVPLAGLASCSDKPDPVVDTLAVENASLLRNRDAFAAAVAEYAGLVNDLDSVLSLPTERRTRDGELVDDRQRRRAILQRARELMRSLDSLSTRIATLEQAAQRSDASAKSSIASIQALRKTIDQLTEMRDRQTAEITRMTQQYDSLAVVSASNQQAAETFQAALADVVEAQESVYVAIGTPGEMTRRGVVRKRGGVVGLGSTLVPVLAFKVEQFQARRMSSDTVIVFPDSAGVYRVLTGQNPQGARGRDLGRLRGSLVIEDPKAFWRDSRFLVVVRR